MTRAEGASVFATTRLENRAMRRTLEHLGFALLGEPWTSKRGEHRLVLYTTPAKAAPTRRKKT